nr:hypothetical protein [Tanacetum cinerariifolium]
VVANEVVYEEMYDSVERAATTALGLDAEQDRGIISKTQFTTTLNEPSSIGTSSGSGPRRQETIVNILRSSKDRLKLSELMELCTQLQLRVLVVETTKTIGSSRRIESLDEASLGDQEDASKQQRINDNLDADEGVTLVDETQRRNDQDMFDTGVLDDEEVVSKKEVSTADLVTTAGEVVTTACVEVNIDATTPIISMDDITLTKALASLKSAKPMVKEPSVPKAKGIVMQELEETTIRTTTEKWLARQKEEKANIALIAEWDDVQAMMDADHELAEILQAEEQGELTIKERSKLFVKLMNERKMHFAGLRAEEKKRKLPTKAQKRKQIYVTEGSSKRAGEELESDKSKKQKLDEQVEVEEDNDQEEAEMKMYMKIISDDEITLDVIPLATKPLIIMLQNINREYLETLWKLVKAKKQSDSLEAIFFMWSSFCEVSKSAYLYAGRVKKVNIKFRGGFLGFKDFMIILELLLIREIVFETYEGFKVLAIEMKTLATGLDVHYEVINAWCDVLNTIENDRKDYDKTVRKYCFKTGFLSKAFTHDSQMDKEENNLIETPILKNVYQRRIKSNSKKKNIASFVCNDNDDSIDEVDTNIILKEVVKDINKSSVEYTEDNSNDEDNEDSHSAEEEQNIEDSDSLKTPPVRKCGRPKKIVRANENKSSSVKRRGHSRKRNDESKKQTIGSKQCCKNRPRRPCNRRLHATRPYNLEI